MLRKYLHKFTCFFLRIVFRFFAYLEIRGANNLLLDNNTKIIASTHASLLDVLIIGAACPIGSNVHPFNYIAASWLGRIPVVGWILHYLGGAVYIKRKKEARDDGESVSMRRVLQICINILEQDKGALVVFPEAGRTNGEEVGQVKRGSAYLSLKTGLPTIPMAIYGQKNTSFFEFLFRKRHYAIVIGSPVNPTINIDNPKDYKEGGNQIRVELEKLFKEAKEIVKQKTAH